MLYKFKSQAAADVIMQRSNGEQMLNIIGKPLAPQGVITVDQIPAAIKALEMAILEHEAAQTRIQAGLEPGAVIEAAGVMLRQRAAPFIDLLRYSAAAGKDVVWGV